MFIKDDLFSNCDDWKSLTFTVFGHLDDNVFWADYFIYIFLTIFFSCCSYFVVIWGSKNYQTNGTSTKKQQNNSYHAAGSGLPELKVILGGYIIKGFLGINTLFVKTIGLVNII